MVDLPRGKRKPFNLYDREFVYTLPSGEVVVITPHKGSRGLATVPEGTKIEVRKLDQLPPKEQNN